MTGSWDELKNFITWFGNLPILHRVLIFGNHDLSMDTQLVYDTWRYPRGRGERDVEAIKKKAIDLMEKLGITYLNDSGIEIDGVKFWGSNVQPEFHAWAFNRQRGDDIQKHWDMITKDTNILLTHGPPKGILDYVPYTNENVGCENLRDTVLTLSKLRINCFGHIHRQHGVTEIDGVTYINASNLNDRYEVAYEPITVELP